MDSRVLLNSRDVLAGYRADFLGSWESLFSCPEGKEPKANDWHEAHGLEVDLEDGIKLKPRKITLQYYFSDVEEGRNFAGDFQGIEGGSGDISVPGYGRIKARALSSRIIHQDYIGGIAIVAIEIEQNEYPTISEYPVTESAHGSELTLDGVPVSHFGATELDGVGTAFHTFGTVKRDGIEIDASDTDGVWVQKGKEKPRKRACEVELPLLFIEPEGTRLRSTLYKFVKELTKPGARKLYWGGLEYSAYYLGLDCKDIVINSDWFAVCALRLMRITQ